MVYSYFPGCTLKDTAKKLDICARESAKVLGIDLREIPEWQCCGAVYPAASDEIATRLSSVRALMSASSKGGVLVTMCSACHHVLKRTNAAWNTDENFRIKATNYMKPEVPYDGGVKVIHFLELLRDEIGFDNLKKMVVKPLSGRKIGAFYGCMFLRPSAQMAFDDPENPTVIEDFISALGATPVKYPYRNECCGGYIELESKQAAETQVDRALRSARLAGAEELVTACPLCLYNLVHNATGDKLPVSYFTELLAEALGITEA